MSKKKHPNLVVWLLGESEAVELWVLFLNQPVDLVVDLASPFNFQDFFNKITPMWKAGLIRVCLMRSSMKGT